MQSSPIYCGGVATLMGDSEGGVVCVCTRHEDAIKRITGIKDFDH